MRLDQRLDFGTYCFLKKHKISLFIFICLKSPVSLASYPNRSVQVERGKRKRIGERGNLQLLFTAKRLLAGSAFPCYHFEVGFLAKVRAGLSAMAVFGAGAGRLLLLPIWPKSSTI